jgi:trigger factor
MQIHVEDLAHSQVKLTVTLTVEQMAQFKKEAVAALQNQVKVAGFRPGHIPVDVLLKQVGEEAFLGVMMDKAISSTYEKVIRDKKIRPVDYPALNVLEHEPLKYEATVSVMPAIKWKKDPKTLKLKGEKLEVNAKEVEKVFEDLKKRTATWKDFEGKAKMGHRVEIDFDGFDLEGNALPGTASKNHPVILGEGSLIPGFEEEVVGMILEQEKEFPITFPKDYHSEDFKGKKVKFKIKLNRIEESELKEMDDEFAKQITGGNRQNLKELEQEIKDELMHQKEHEETARLEKEFLKELVSIAEAEIPEAMVEREKEMMIERMKRDFSRQNKTQSWEDYEKSLDLQKPAREQVLMRLALEELQAKEPVELSEAEIEEEVAHTLGHYPAEYRGMVAERYAKNSEGYEMLVAQMKLRKMVAKHCA